MAKTKKKKFVLTSFSIIFIIIVLLGIVSHLLPKAVFNGEEIVNGSGVVGAKISDILSAERIDMIEAVKAFCRSLRCRTYRVLFRQRIGEQYN